MLKKPTCVNMNFISICREERFRGNFPQDSHEIFRVILECIRSEESNVYYMCSMYSVICECAGYPDQYFRKSLCILWPQTWTTMLEASHWDTIIISIKNSHIVQAFTLKGINLFYTPPVS